jgi:DNA-binding transcriptional MerR regulator
MQTFGIGAFARRAGVTVRTVRYYDQVDLLKPSAYSDAGRRLYSELDYARLQQILTLKLIGLSLEEIRSLLTADRIALAQLLEQQRRALHDKMRRLAGIIQTIEGAQRSLHASQTIDLEQFINIIKAVNMSNQSDWFGQFMTAEQQAKLAAGNNGSLADQRQTGAAWQMLFQDIQARLNEDPADPAVQALLDRWQALNAGLADDLMERLIAAYTHLDTLPGVEDAPPAVQDWLDDMQAAARLIHAARVARPAPPEQ